MPPTFQSGGKDMLVPPHFQTQNLGMCPPHFVTFLRRWLGKLKGGTCPRVPLDPPLMYACVQVCVCVLCVCVCVRARVTG